MSYVTPPACVPVASACESPFFGLSGSLNGNAIAAAVGDADESDVDLDGVVVTVDGVVLAPDCAVFSNSHASESAGYALLRTHAAAIRFAHTAAAVKTGGLFATKAVAVQRFVVAVTAATAAGAKTLLALALAHLHRSER